MQDRYDPPEEARSQGLRRMSRLTWRATQLGALATVGFATLFARTAPAATVSSPPAPKATTATKTSSPTPSPTQTHAWHHRRHHHHHHPAAAPAAVPSSAPAPAPSLAPPSTPPAPPPPSPKPSPVHSSSSPSHHGGG